ncbi:MAG TPA: hypothetical protein VE890_05855 [Thermoguttaceae bacterium]|nr:hypothetical protein [Thermoguttaceae bacterium]
MPVTITEYTENMTEQVRRFNARLEAAGEPLRFPTSHIPEWLPKVAGQKLYQEYYLAADEASNVRGAYVLKHQEFLLNGQTLSIADFRLPISEGVADRQHNSVGVLLLLDAIRKQPLLFGLGIGSRDEPLSRLLVASGWRLSSVPFFFSIIRPFRFLRHIAHLRGSLARQYLLDVAAFSGLGWSAIKALQTVRYRRPSLQATGVKTETVEEFSGWVDDLWKESSAEYGLAAVRDSETVRLLYPREETRFIRLRTTRQGKAIGWAVLLDTHLTAHKQFGNMRLGSIVDCFSATADTNHVIAAATEFLERRGVDLIVSNQAHAAWCKAFDTCGFMRGPSNFLFAASKALKQRLDEAGVKNDDIHMTRGDGDGPIHL